jgi:hypothetical protein
MNNIFSKIIFWILSLYGNIIYSQCELQEIYFNNHCCPIKKFLRKGVKKLSLIYSIFV